jgi:hypothetical protein
LEHVLKLECLELRRDGVRFLLELALQGEIQSRLRLEQLVELAGLLHALAQRVVGLEPALEGLHLLDYLPRPRLVGPHGAFRHGVLELAQPLGLSFYVKGSSAARRDGVAGR